jgi:pimeloyl-ACP methyl ester carboxylesterase
MAGLVTRRPEDKKLTHALALFPGSPGQPKLQMQNGQLAMEQRGNFLIRARRHFLEEGFLTVVIDAPSDQWFGLFRHEFRASPRYGEDVKGLVDEVNKRYGELDWTFIGTSEGSVSAVYAARMVPPKRVVLSSSLTGPNFQGPGLRFSDVKALTMPVLWVHHRRDPCRVTPYSTIKSWAEELHEPLVTVNGSKDARGDPCEARSEHGYAGREVETIKAILAWIRTGQAPAEVGE